jgi:threonine/homoserine/homoserine lactone efflux protein
MELAFFLKGAVIGFAMAIPIGPIGVMCVRKTLTEGHLRGLTIGLGAATADLLFSCVAAFGLTVISSAIDILFSWGQEHSAGPLIIPVFLKKETEVYDHISVQFF